MPITSDGQAVIVPPTARELHPAMNPHRWKPGQSGNPSGRSKMYGEAMRICREASPEAAHKMVALMSSDDHRVAYMAASAVLERAWGKPKEFDPNSQSKPPLDLSRLDPEALATLRRLLQLALDVDQSQTSE